MSEIEQEARAEEYRWALEDAIRAAMESRQGGLTPDLPRGPRAWGEPDGYWITTHVGPVADAVEQWAASRLTETVTEAKAAAWDEAIAAVAAWWQTPEDERGVIVNPYGTHPADRLLDDHDARSA